ncbi:MAG TPA: branched-chain amino acid transaminase [Thermoanaerobaculia bacterium]|jgi:branched-chain amino acid aminotransferase|nr:branched-chain amino acid transaminase [Thermoanaerobaculia bacterium]
MNGRLVEFEKATVPVMTHALHYGTGVFEGIRCYHTPQGPAVFRLAEHMERLLFSAKICRMDLPFSASELVAAVDETIRANELPDCYIRPIAFRGFGPMGVNPLKSPVDVAIGVWRWGTYLGEEALEKGVDVCVSSWRRPSQDSVPAISKATGNYMNAGLIKMEAVLGGFHEAIALDTAGYVSEGSGENLFLVRDGVLYTPPVASSILAGITRDTVLCLARDFGIAIREETIPRSLLYVCDELFFTGTAAEITPIRSVDRITVGPGRPGEITRSLMAEFRRIVNGEVPDRHGWLHPVGIEATASVA